MTPLANVEADLLLLGSVGRDILRIGQERIPDAETRDRWYEEMYVSLRQRDAEGLISKVDYRFTPVGVQEFVESDYYLNAKNVLYPRVMDALVEMNDGNYNEAVLTGGIGVGKALALDTPIPVPSGWATMGQLQTGDLVYDETGATCRVVKAHDVLLGRKCYRVHFSDGTSIVADEDHLWSTWTKSQRGNGTRPSVVTTKYIASTLSKRHAIEVAGCLQGTDVPGLGVDPYTLGIWLGDGSSDSANVWVADPEILQEISRYYTLTRQARPPGRLEPHTVHGIMKGLRKLGLLGNKHIPPLLLRASEAQRLALLQGLMDSDGHADARTGRCSFSNTNKILALGVLELVRSLGWKPSLREDDATLSGRFVSRCWEVSWAPSRERPVFRLPRKLERQGLRTGLRKGGHSKWRVIEKVEAVESVPVRCITVDSPSRLYLAGEAMVPTHNTTIALYSTAYQLYLLSALRNPQKTFGLDPSSEIVFIFQSLNERLAKGVDYLRFKTMVETSHYFAENFKFDRDVESELHFDKRIIVKPVTGSAAGAIGQNVFGGVIDEINFMAVVDSSKKASDGGTYNQAIELYNSIARRRQSRFMVQGRLPGLLCLVSSKRYPGQFTDQKTAEAQEEVARTGKTGIYIYDKRVWEIKPKGSFSEKTFTVFIGDESRKPKIIEDDHDREGVEPELLMDIPDDYRREFDKDLLNSLRDIAGVSTLATHPFITDRESISQCFRKEAFIFNRESVDFQRTKLAIFREKFYRPEIPRFVHVDLAISQDSAGFAVGTVTGFTDIDRGQVVETLPNIYIDGLLQIAPPPNGEILISKIRDIIYTLKKLGLNIRWVTFDTFQSTDSLQILRQAGYIVGYQSMDKTPNPYTVLKYALYDGRVSLPYHRVVEKELISLERDVKKNRIDHPPTGSKDVSDALAGVVFGCTMRRDFYGLYKVPVQKIPESLRSLAPAKDNMREPDKAAA